METLQERRALVENVPGHDHKRGGTATVVTDRGPAHGAPLARFDALAADPGRVLVKDFHAVKHAIRFQAVINQILTVDKAALLAMAAALAPDVEPVLRAHAIEIDPLAWKSHHQTSDCRTIALAGRPEGALPLSRRARRGRPLVLLENPRNLGNIGAVIRVAAAADAAGVITTGGPDIWHPTVIRGSAGLHFALPVGTLTTLEGLEGPIVAMTGKGRALGEVRLPVDSVFAFGTERHGLGDPLLSLADHKAAIRMRAGVSSLNLATAVAVTLYGVT